MSMNSFGLQAIEHALHAQRLAAEHGLAQLEDVIARNIHHRTFDLVERQDPTAGTINGKQQAQLLNFLVRGEQVALDPIGKKLQRALTFFSRNHALPLCGQAPGNPLRQCGAFYGLYLQGHAKTLQRDKPGAGLGHLVQPRQQDDSER